MVTGSIIVLCGGLWLVVLVACCATLILLIFCVLFFVFSCGLFGFTPGRALVPSGAVWVGVCPVLSVVVAGCFSSCLLFFCGSLGVCLFAVLLFFLVLLFVVAVGCWFCSASFRSVVVVCFFWCRLLAGVPFLCCSYSFWSDPPWMYCFFHF